MKSGVREVAVLNVCPVSDYLWQLCNSSRQIRKCSLSNIQTDMKEPRRISIALDRTLNQRRCASQSFLHFFYFVLQKLRLLHLASNNTQSLLAQESQSVNHHEAAVCGCLRIYDEESKRRLVVPSRTVIYYYWIGNTSARKSRSWHISLFDWTWWDALCFLLLRILWKNIPTFWKMASVSRIKFNAARSIYSSIQMECREFQSLGEVYHSNLSLMPSTTTSNHPLTFEEWARSIRWHCCRVSISRILPVSL